MEKFFSRVRQKTVLIVVALLLLSTLKCSRGEAQNGTFFSASDLNATYDFVFTVTVNKLQNYLKYPNSSLYPIVNLKITYRNTGHLGHGNVSAQDILYEELWYHNEKPIGCRQYVQLNLNSGEQGCIWFQPINDYNDASYCASDAIARLMLDIANEGSALSVSYVPASIFNQTVSNFGQLQFYPETLLPEHGLPATMHIHLSSQPTGQDQTVYYMPN